MRYSGSHDSHTTMTSTVARPPNTNPDAIQAAKRQICGAHSLDELRAAQAVLLPLLGLSLDQTAEAVGKSRFWVSRARSAVLAGRPPPAEHGGRRNEIVAEEEEVQLLRRAIRNAFERPAEYMFRRYRVQSAVHDLLDQESGRAVSASTVRAFMGRVVPKLLPQLEGVSYGQYARDLDRYWQAEQALQTRKDLAGNG